MRSAARFVSTFLLLNFSVPLSRVGATPVATLLVAAAADLQPAQNQLASAFSRYSGQSAAFTFGASGNLAQQIEHGAPYDIYLAANELFVRQLTDQRRLLKDSVQVYAHGRLALWSKSGTIRSLQDLTSPKILHVAIANPAHAPYGAAARAALQNQGLWEKLQPKIVYGENVEQAFQFAQSGNADAAITAWSLLLHKGGIQLPNSWHPPITQTAGIVAATKHPAAARKFMEFLLSKEGKTVLHQFGLED